MKEWKEKQHIFFGEDALFKHDDKEEEAQAKEYLTLWKKFLLLKLRNELCNYELIDEVWGNIQPYAIGPFNSNSTIYLKLAFIKKLPSEINGSGDNRNSTV